MPVVAGAPPGTCTGCDGTGCGTGTGYGGIAPAGVGAGIPGVPAGYPGVPGTGAPP